MNKMIITNERHTDELLAEKPGNSISEGPHPLYRILDVTAEKSADATGPTHPHKNSHKSNHRLTKLKGGPA